MNYCVPLVTCLAVDGEKRLRVVGADLEVGQTCWE